MNIAVTGATGFIGRYLVEELCRQGHSIRALCRTSSNVTGLPANVDWVEGGLDDEESLRALLQGADKVVHAAVYRPAGGFQNNDVPLIKYLEVNLMGSLRILELAKESNIKKLVYISSCAVHDQILADRPLDELHPLMAKSHYGAHKAAVEKFIHSFGFGQSRPYCALRPTGVYGTRSDAPTESKWYGLIKKISESKDVTCSGGGKEVHVSDVVKAILLLLDASNVSGEVFNCYDRYISEYDIAHLAKEISGSSSSIFGEQTRPKNEISTDKIAQIGMIFGGEALMRKTVEELLGHIALKMQ